MIATLGATFDVSDIDSADLLAEDNRIGHCRVDSKK